MALAAAAVSSKGEQNFADLRVAQHIAVRVGDPFEREGFIEHWLERARFEQISGETLAANQRLFRRARAER